MNPKEDLTPQEMEFLAEWEQLGKDENAEEIQGEEFDLEALEVDPEGGIEGELPDPNAEHEGESEEIVAGEGGAAPTDEAAQMDIGNQDAPVESPEAPAPDHLEEGEGDEIHDGEDDLEFDPGDEGVDDEQEDSPDEDFEDPGVLDDAEDVVAGENAKIEEDDGEGERGNSDEARELDTPIEHTPQADAEQEADDNFDAQAELEAHLDNAGKQDQGEAEAEQNPDPAQEQPVADENPPEQAESPQEQEQQGGGAGQGRYDDLPESPEGCDDHCEDDEPEDDDAIECPHCTERIRREREEWGVIATDKNGVDILPGDKLEVVVPVSFTVPGMILTANVPNLAEDRFAETTGGDAVTDVCWLSGRGRISEFTGYHMSRGGAIWTFERGKQLKFVRKIGEITGQLQGNADPEDLVENLMKDLDEFGGEEKQPEPEQPVEEEKPEVEAEEIEDDDEAELDEEVEEDDEAEEDEAPRDPGALTATQMKRFENLFDRLAKKVAGTFGNTAEHQSAGEIFVRDNIVAKPITVISRGVAYNVVLTARRHIEE